MAENLSEKGGPMMAVSAGFEMMTTESSNAHRYRRRRRWQHRELLLLLLLLQPLARIRGTTLGARLSSTTV